VKLLTKSTASTNTLSQHLGCAHADKLEGYRLNSTRSKYSSQAVKECKEQIVVAAARESSNQGGIWYDPHLIEHIYAVLGVKFFAGSHRAVDCQSLLMECFEAYKIKLTYVHLSVATVLATFRT